MGGAFIVSAKSAQYPERLVGEGLSGVILSEAAKLKDKIWPKYIRPTLADYNGWSFHSSTLKEKTGFMTCGNRAAILTTKIGLAGVCPHGSTIMSTKPQPMKITLDRC